MTNDEASDARRVWPSGADFATYSAPMIWFAPGLFSTMTGWPRSSERRAPIWRERASVAPPGEVGTTILTGREGNCWPRTDIVASAHDRVKSRPKMVFTALSSSASQGSLASAAAPVAEMRHLPQICSQRLINLLVIKPERDHERKNTPCPDHPAAAVRLCRQHSRHGAARRQPPAADHEREPEGRGGQHDQYEGGGRAGLSLAVGGRERWIRIAHGRRQAWPLQGGREP